MQIIYGYQSVKEALNNKNRKKYKLFLSTNKIFKYDNIIKISKEKMYKICQSNDHNGVALEVDQFCHFASLKDMGSKILIISSMEDVGNMGAIIRSAAVLGYNVLLGTKNTSIINGRMVKNASGAFEFVKIHICKNLYSSIIEIKNQGYKIFAMSEKYLNKPYNKEQNYNKIALIIGGESQGIDSQLLSKIDVFFKIPGTKKFNTLNASVAAAIGMFKFGNINL
ncbi:hypothetical protein AB836_01225 [Rickettsiales bacterium (ex Bugula neritina AB1)]|nr:hypothetical protein AB836_01225 [Rickettsiales bacterium (ex Bugula neritina AB1)]